MTCSICGRDNIWHGSENSPPPGSYLSEMGCHDGVLMDDDEYHEGWQPDVVYPPCPHSPLKCQTCNGTGICPAHIDSTSDDCPMCDGVGWKDGKCQWPSTEMV